MWVPHALYSQILQSIPIPCVDLVVSDLSGKVLLLLRKNPPAAGHWWFPGGRVLFGETRADAARRKLQEECGLAGSKFVEIGTFDLIFESVQSPKIHSITTLFSACVQRPDDLLLDDQSLEACWLEPRQWLERDLHPFVLSRLTAQVSEAIAK